MSSSNGMIIHGNLPGANNNNNIGVPFPASSLWPTYIWGGRLGHHVPEGWLFPNPPIKTLFDLWFLGNQVLRIGPYRKIEHWDLPPRSSSIKKKRPRQSEVDITNDEEKEEGEDHRSTTTDDEQKKRQRSIDNSHVFLSNARIVMKRLTDVGIQQQKIRNERDLLSKSQVELDIYFNVVYPLMMHQAYGGIDEGRRIGELTLAAVYKDIVTNRHKVRRRITAEALT
jgi:predicted acylesterase/phospholipase RssA